MPTMAAVPIQRQIQCVERELGFRERVYARRVAEGKMTAQKAAEEVEVMQAVLATLQTIETGQRLI